MVMVVLDCNRFATLPSGPFPRGTRKLPVVSRVTWCRRSRGAYRTFDIGNDINKRSSDGIKPITASTYSSLYSGDINESQNVSC